MPYINLGKTKQKTTQLAPQLVFVKLNERCVRTYLCGSKDPQAEEQENTSTHDESNNKLTQHSGTSGFYTRSLVHMCTISQSDR